MIGAAKLAAVANDTAPAPRRPTVLDQLTSPTVTPAILRVRAQYWRVVADRNERHGRADQAHRLRVNCDAMERQAEEIERAPNVTTIVPTGTRKRAAVARSAKVTAEQFWTLYRQAVTAIAGRHGERWRVIAPVGETILVTLPTGLCSYTGPRGGKIRYRRDQRMPAASFWPGGVLPCDLVITPEVPREGAHHRGPEILREIAKLRRSFCKIVRSRRGPQKPHWRGETPEKILARKTKNAREALVAIRELREQLGIATFQPERNAAWLEARGCVNRGGHWIHWLEAQLFDAREEQVRIDQVRRDLDRAFACGMIGEEFTYAAAA